MITSDEATHALTVDGHDVTQLAFAVTGKILMDARDEVHRATMERLVLGDMLMVTAYVTVNSKSVRLNIDAEGNTTVVATTSARLDSIEV